MKKKPAGVVLVLVVIYLLVLTTIGLAVVQILAQEQMFSTMSVVNSRAFYLAYAGIEISKGWLHKQTRFPENLGYISTFHVLGWPTVPPSYNGGGGPLGLGSMTGTMTYTITPSPSNNVSPIWTQSICGKYIISSTGTVTVGSAYNTTQNVSITVFISTTTVAGVPGYFAIVPNSWVKNPVQRN